MERRKEQAMTFYSPKVNKIKGDLKYQQPTLPTNKQSMSAQKRQQYLSEAYTYTRMFCASLSGFSLLLLICTSPMHWVQFLVTNNGLELNAGLWTLCNHELCWSHILKPPSQVFLFIRVLVPTAGLALQLISSHKQEEIHISKPNNQIDPTQAKFPVLSP
nr:transmembrane protein 202 isoform X1 [Rattus norvegicus]